MLNDQASYSRKVLVELSVIPLGGNGHFSDQITEVLNIADKTGLFYERWHNGACIEGDWSDIGPLIYACYERVQEQSPQGFLTVSIR